MRLLVIAALMLGAVRCGSGAPDTILLNGRIFTANPTQPWAEAVAIRGDRIVAIGETAVVGALASARTATHDLSGRTVIPGLNDAHVITTEPGALAVRALAQVGIAFGVTSMHVFSMSRPVADTARDLVAASAPMRFRVLRAPRIGSDGETTDSRPHLPPQPSLRVDVRGMALVAGREDIPRIRQFVGWAYGSEDPLSFEPLDREALSAFVEAIEQTGVAEVWARKRPRVENLDTIDPELGARLARAGVIVVQRRGEPRPLASVLDHSVTLALGTGTGTNPFALLAWAVSPERGDERLTVEQAVVAMTRGSARAEFADGDKGHLSVGSLADLTVLSGDVFTLAPDRLATVQSVLTLISGHTVYDVP